MQEETAKAPRNRGCRCRGGSGTFYSIIMADGLEVADLAAAPANHLSMVSGHLMLNNNDFCANATSVTSVNAAVSLPNAASVTLLGGALLSVPANTQLILRSGLYNKEYTVTEATYNALDTPCNLHQVRSYKCSYLYISGTAGASASRTGLAFDIDTIEQKNLTMSIDYIHLKREGSIYAAVTSKGYLTALTAALDTDTDTLVSFRARVTIKLAFGARLLGSIIEENDSDTYALNSGLTIASVGHSDSSLMDIEHRDITIVGEIKVHSSITVFAVNITLDNSAYVGIRSLCFLCVGQICKNFNAQEQITQRSAPDSSITLHPSPSLATFTVVQCI